MVDRNVLSVYSHSEDYAALKPGDKVLVRWDDDGAKRWYECPVETTTQGGCHVRWGITLYYVDFDLDETLCCPQNGAYLYIKTHPDCVCVEIMGTKYLVPNERLNFYDTLQRINLLRRMRLEPEPSLRAEWASESVGSMAERADFKRVVFSPSPPPPQ